MSDNPETYSSDSDNLSLSSHAQKYLDVSIGCCWGGRLETSQGRIFEGGGAFLEGKPRLAAGQLTGLARVHDSSLWDDLPSCFRLAGVIGSILVSSRHLQQCSMSSSSNHQACRHTQHILIPCRVCIIDIA